VPKSGRPLRFLGFAHHLKPSSPIVNNLKLCRRKGLTRLEVDQQKQDEDGLVPTGHREQRRSSHSAVQDYCLRRKHASLACMVYQFLYGLALGGFVSAFDLANKNRYEYFSYVFFFHRTRGSWATSSRHARSPQVGGTQPCGSGGWARSGCVTRWARNMQLELLSWRCSSGHRSVCSLRKTNRAAGCPRRNGICPRDGLCIFLGDGRESGQPISSANFIRLPACLIARSRLCFWRSRNSGRACRRLQPNTVSKSKLLYD
jgi:hypothetical protein